MAFCPKCGNQVNDGSAFCAKCGAATGPSSAAGATAGAAAAPAQAPSTGMTNNVAAMLTYIPFFVGLILGIIFLVIEPYNKTRFVRFHALQSIFLHVGMFALWIGWWIVQVILIAVTHGLMLFIVWPLSMLLWLGFLAAMIFLMVKAYGNQEVKFPIIGQMADKQAGA